MRGAAVLILISLSAAGCGGSGAPPAEESTDESYRFENIDAAFVGDAACFDCHEEEYRGFQEHGMASSLYPLTPDRAVEDFSGATVRDDERDLTYRMFRDGDRFFQEEYRLGADGEKTHSLVREMEVVVGSGTAARTYLVEENGHYFELPVTWYTQSQRWAFSPGYETSNARFDRLIPDRCMTCHNSYPEPVPFVEGKYADVPFGIGCERCHGPGSVHVDARLAAPAPADSVDETIVNPAHLTLERRLDVCQQCHLHSTVSILREGRTAYDFRPSQPLAEYVAFFGSDEPAPESSVDVISHAERMRQSACFVGSQALERPMDCTTCHDPHEGFRTEGPEYFNETCRTCHEVSSLQAALPEGASAEHTDAGNCFACHMPKVEAEGTPHASFTDHRIRVVDEDVVPPAGGSGGGLVPYFAQDASDGIYAGMAYVIYGRQQGDSTTLRRGVELLQDRLEGEAAAGFGEALYLLGFAYQQLGEPARAIEPLERSVTQDPNVPERLNTLALAYEADGRSTDAVERLYARALEIQPALASVRVNYGRFLEARQRLDGAIAQYRSAIEEHAWLETAHFNLGSALLRSGDFEAGEDALQEAIRLDPDYGEALSNLGLVLAATGRESEAGAYFERAVAAEPENPVALGNFGAFRLNADRLEEAVSLLDRAVALDPQYVDGLVNLALAYFRLEEVDLARTYAERALQLAPENPMARQILGAL